MDLRLFYFHVTKCPCSLASEFRDLSAANDRQTENEEKISNRNIEILFFKIL